MVPASCWDSTPFSTILESANGYTIPASDHGFRDSSPRAVIVKRPAGSGSHVVQSCTSTPTSQIQATFAPDIRHRPMIRIDLGRLSSGKSSDTMPSCAWARSGLTTGRHPVSHQDMLAGTGFAVRQLHRMRVLDRRRVVKGYQRRIGQQLAIPTPSSRSKLVDSPAFERVPVETYRLSPAKALCFVHQFGIAPKQTPSAFSAPQPRIYASPAITGPLEARATVAPYYHPPSKHARANPAGHRHQ